MKILKSKRGQSAMEYMTTYGWAILVVLIVGLVVWQLGLFDMEGRMSQGFSGFSIVVPQDWKVESTGPVCVLTVQLLNGAGEEIQNITVSGGSDCSPSTLEPGEYTFCSRQFSGCGDSGSHYNEGMSVIYKRSDDEQEFQTAGEVWGSVD